MQQAFLDGLEEIRRIAAAGDGSVSVADILGAFPGTELNEEQIEQIYDYLDKEGISLKDYVPHDTRSVELGADEGGGTLSPEEQQLLDFYLEDMEGIRPMTAAEENALISFLLDGTDEEKDRACLRLTEGNLHSVLSIAKDHAGKGVPLIDLVQEGNLSLIESLRAYQPECGDLGNHLEKEIRRAIRALIREEAGFDRMQAEMTASANRILEEVKAAEAETGRALTAEELSLRLGMPVGKVDEVLRESAKAIKNAEKR